MYLVLGSATGLKLLCWAVCAALQAKSDNMLALAEDHLNDILSNVCAIITAIAAGAVAGGWWIDPAGAIAISLYIVARWLAIAKQQVGCWCWAVLCCLSCRCLVVRSACEFWCLVASQACPHPK